MSDGMPVMTGASSSVTVTLNVMEAGFPSSSVYVYVTGVTPTSKEEPDAMSELSELLMAQLSETVGSVQLTAAVQEPVAPTEATVSCSITGAWLSSTVTVAVADALLP